MTDLHVMLSRRIKLLSNVVRLFWFPLLVFARFPVRFFAAKVIISPVSSRSYAAQYLKENKVAAEAKVGLLYLLLLTGEGKCTNLLCGMTGSTIFSLSYKKELTTLNFAS